MTAGNGAAVCGKEQCNKEKGKKGAVVAAASTGANAKTYMPMKLSSSREAHTKAMAVGLEGANAILHF